MRTPCAKTFSTQNIVSQIHFAFWQTPFTPSKFGLESQPLRNLHHRWSHLASRMSLAACTEVQKMFFVCNVAVKATENVFPPQSFAWRDVNIQSDRERWTSAVSRSVSVFRLCRVFMVSAFHQSEVFMVSLFHQANFLLSFCRIKVTIIGGNVLLSWLGGLQHRSKSNTNSCV